MRRGRTPGLQGVLCFIVIHSHESMLQRQKTNKSKSNLRVDTRHRYGASSPHWRKSDCLLEKLEMSKERYKELRITHISKETMKEMQSAWKLDLILKQFTSHQFTHPHRPSLQPPIPRNRQESQAPQLHNITLRRTASRRRRQRPKINVAELPIRISPRPNLSAQMRRISFDAIP